MSKRRYIAFLLLAAALIILPTHTGRVLAQSAICGQFADVSASSGFCPFILEAFYNNITQGTSATTFNPGDFVSRDQAATFVTRTMDQTLHRATGRMAIGKTWTPIASNGGIGTDVGGSVNDIVTDGTFLWVGRADGKILKLSVADRRLLETWSLSTGAPRRLGVFAGQVWIAGDQGRLFSFNPTDTAGTANLLFNSSATGIAAGVPSLAFDGVNVWLASTGGTNIFIYPIGNSGGISYTAAANINGMVFDGTYMWVLLANSSLLKMTAPTTTTPPNVVEIIPLPGPVNDCRMLYDGSNIWIPIGGTDTLYVVRPTQNLALPSSIVSTQAIPDVGFPYVTAFDGENVMVGGTNNGVVALYRATTLSLIRTFSSGAIATRGIASDGRTFNIGDSLGTRFFQF